MIGGDMYEFPDGTVGSNAGDCAQAWADEARSLRAEVEALKEERDECKRRAVWAWEHLDRVIYSEFSEDARSWNPDEAVWFEAAINALRGEGG